MEFFKAFILGGALCAVGQVLIDRTRLTPARILVAYAQCPLVAMYTLWLSSVEAK